MVAQCAGRGEAQGFFGRLKDRAHLFTRCSSRQSHRRPYRGGTDLRDRIGEQCEHRARVFFQVLRLAHHPHGGERRHPGLRLVVLE